MIRLAVNGVVTGCEFTPYLPFVLLGAVLLRWWQAGIVALGSVAVLGGLFSGGRNFQLPCFESAALIFLGSSVVIIGIAVVLRYAVVTIAKRVTGHPTGGIVFSLERGQVWASWYGDGSPVLLGSQPNVSEMMRDFLEQEQVARRLTRSARDAGD